MIDARRREVFTIRGGEPIACRPDELALEPGAVLVGDGAVRYRAVLEAAGADIPPDGDPVHVPRASLHARLATDFGDADLVEPIYVRLPDAERGARVSTTSGLDIQPLQLDDVTAIEAIEQRSMPAPWSRMMFVSEIVKTTSICLGAFIDDALVAYVIVSRYVDAWHVMNLVVVPEYRRQGIATRLLATLFEGPPTTTGAGSRSRCASRTTPRSSCTKASGSVARASAAATTRTTARTR